MRIRVIGIKEFRRDITILWKEARDDDTHFIITHHSRPVLRVFPMEGAEFTVEEIARAIEGIKLEI